MSINVVFDNLPTSPDDNQIAQDLQGIHSEDTLFSNEVKQIICPEKSNTLVETTSTDFDIIKQLVLTNHNLKEFISDVENKFSSNIDRREEEMKRLTFELKELTEKIKI